MRMVFGKRLSKLLSSLKDWYTSQQSLNFLVSTASEKASETKRKVIDKMLQHLKVR